MTETKWELPSGQTKSEFLDVTFYKTQENIVAHSITLQQ
jgi:hypothetical protein